MRHLALFLALLQDDPTIYEVKYRHEKALRECPGVLDVSIGGGGNDLRLLIRVNSEEARQAVAKRYGDRIEGYRITILVSRTSGPTSSSGECAHCACPCHRRGGSTVAEPRPQEPKSEDCDVVREIFGKPRVKRDASCQQMIVWTNDPVRIRWVVDQGLPHMKSQDYPSLRGSDNKGAIACLEHREHPAGEVIAYTYVKHRRSCSYGASQVMKEIERMTPTQGK